MRKDKLSFFFTFSLAICLASRAHAGAAGPWEPRTSRLTAPELPAESRLYKEEAIPGSYVSGASLALTERGVVCVSPFDPEVGIEAANVWEDGETWVDRSRIITGGYRPASISSIITDGNECAFIMVDAYNNSYGELICFPIEDTSTYTITKLGEPSEIRQFADDPPRVGPMLRMADNGRLLFAGADGRLHTAGIRGEDVRDIEGVAATEFVYHGGVVCFANLDDVKTYSNVITNIP